MPVIAHGAVNFSATLGGPRVGVEWLPRALAVPRADPVHRRPLDETVQRGGQCHSGERRDDRGQVGGQAHRERPQLLKQESDRALVDLIRYRLSLAPEKPLNCLRRKIGLRATCL